MIPTRLRQQMETKMYNKWKDWVKPERWWMWITKGKMVKWVYTKIKLNRISTELTLNLSHKWSPPKEKPTGHIDEAFLDLPNPAACK
jgi:hypothetical protein